MCRLLPIYQCDPLAILQPGDGIITIASEIEAIEIAIVYVTQQHTVGAFQSAGHLPGFDLQDKISKVTLSIVPNDEVWRPNLKEELSIAIALAGFGIGCFQPARTAVAKVVFKEK